jgi:hypothetical protein
MRRDLPLYGTLSDWATWANISRVALHRQAKGDPSFPKRRLAGKYYTPEMLGYFDSLAKDTSGANIEGVHP